MTQMFDDHEVVGQDGLVLDPMSPSYALDCFQACQDAEIHKWLPLPRPYTRELAEEWCNSGAELFRRSGNGIHYAIVDSGVFAGCISAKNARWREGILEIGYWVAFEARGRRVATRAVRALSYYSFERGFQRLELRIAPENVNSIKVAKRNSFVYEGELRSAGITHDGRINLSLFSLLKSDAFH